jgi:thiosulfate/3-mercaptopyruvate sulfurtransferase
MVPHDEADTGGTALQIQDEILAECATVGISQNTPVYLYCFKGARAANTFLALKNAGVKDVRMYFGSWNEWSRDPSLPIEEGLPTDARLSVKAA